MTGKVEEGSNANELPQCKSVAGKMMCKMPGTTEFVEMPEDWSELFSPITQL
jgi:hypothetical protein